MSTAGAVSLSPLRLLRTLLRPLAIHAAYSPIETIVFFCVVGILSYFHILNTVKHSSFFLPPSHPYSPAVVSGHAGTNLRPAYVLAAAAANGETEWSWTPTREGVWKASKAGEAEYLPVEFVQVVFRPDAVSEHSDDRLDALDEVRNVTLELVNRYKEKKACFLVSGTGQCFEHFNEAAWTHTIGFIPSALANAKEDVTKRLAKLAPSTASRWKFTVQDDQKAAEVSIGEMKSSRWVAYAARALVLRFWDLAKVRFFYQKSVIE
jgi:hydroxymethylglutaryl-CoA reductase (NADPH)